MANDLANDLANDSANDSANDLVGEVSRLGLWIIFARKLTILPKNQSVP